MDSYSFVYSLIMCIIFFTNAFLLEAEKINECIPCKVFTDSFLIWLEKTARGKHEGGDAAWEETKLKAYSRSEMRLVEIQEGLCSDVVKHKDQCYTFSEEVDHLLEKWWINENSSSQDLYSWLCINTLQKCCPKNHYGKSCLKCKLDMNGQICGGRGKCDGDGTRQGNGSCICNVGYSGQYCESCVKNFYKSNSESCRPCHKACDGCSGEGAAACELCNIGWQKKSDKCVDINECLTTTECKSDQFCVNLEGSYTCKKCDSTCKTCIEKGPDKCTACQASYILWSGMCVSETKKQQLLLIVFLKIFSYICLLLVSLYIYGRSKIVATIVVILIALFFYTYEKHTIFNFLY